MYYTQEQVDRANQADLVSFLQSQGIDPQRKKTIKILNTVDFSLSKQGIFFVTLRQKGPAT